MKEFICAYNSRETRVHHGREFRLQEAGMAAGIAESSHGKSQALK